MAPYLQETITAPAVARVPLWRIYWLSAAVTVAVWVAVASQSGMAGLRAVVVLTLLEVTFSFDNAVMNSKLLAWMSPLWQRLFMTGGILFAVFAVRFVAPIGIVAATAGHGVTDVVRLALEQPDVYAHELHTAGPVIDSFGGTFLLMIGIGFFLSAEKDVHWIGWLERRLAPLGRFDNLTIFVMVLAALTLYATTGAQTAVLVAAICGIALHVGLDLFAAVAGGTAPGRRGTVLVGGAAAVMFARLEVLDASFSLDGVIGAFAISGSVLVIMAGLGAGAMWVRSLTVHMVRAGTLAKLRYLEHGAHWAIVFLATVMIAKLYNVEPPEWVIGTAGLALIAAAAASSIRARRRDNVLDTWGASWPERTTLGEAAEEMDFDLFDDDDPDLVLVKTWVDVAEHATYSVAELADNDAEDRVTPIELALTGDGRDLPPVVVLPGEGLRDGNHRAAIAEAAGHTRMPAYAPAN